MSRAEVRAALTVLYLALAALTASCAAAGGQHPLTVTALTVLIFSPLLVSLVNRP